ncbi:hypothetical protein V6N11_076432 [Hibiscus sabdariffa]|uniref:tRNA(His) guanylyltransferase n=1 Tax=Hibiscus sabdariffa TaxID=183260 RepID=A0ABR2Q684_9ROSI
MPPNLIVVRVDGRNFHRFSEVHEFEKPNDEKALNLMNQCAIAVLEEYPDIVFSYGYSDEYSFVLKKTSKFYQRRSSKISSVIASFFTSVYVTKWKEFFPFKELRYPPSFLSRIVCCASLEVLQAYLAWRQRDCHVQNQYNTCLWELVKKGGKSKIEAQEILKDAREQDRNELLHQQFGINYNDSLALFRQGTCIFKTEVEDIVKYNEDGTPVKRLRRKASTFRTENIAGKRFWNAHAGLVKELGNFSEDCFKINPDYIRSFVFESKLMPSTWIVIRIDGCHFHRFSDKSFKDIVFSYGVSDEYSFVLKKDSQLYQRQASKIVSAIVSFFSSVYVMKWKEIFHNKDLKYPPSFDGRAVCYPSNDILLDYLAWRQVDCHINNQYNTCFWSLVKSGKSKSEAQNHLKGTQAREKNELLLKDFGIDYNTLPLMFRQGSSIFRVKTENTSMLENDASSIMETETKIIIEYYTKLRLTDCFKINSLTFFTLWRIECLARSVSHRVIASAATDEESTVELSQKNNVDAGEKEEPKEDATSTDEELAVAKSNLNAENGSASNIVEAVAGLQEKEVILENDTLGTSRDVTSKGKQLDGTITDDTLTEGKHLDGTITDDTVIQEESVEADEKTIEDVSTKLKLEIVENLCKKEIEGLVEENFLKGNKIFVYPAIVKPDEDIEIHVPKEAYKMDFVFFNGQIMIKKDFCITVEGGMYEFALEDFLLEEKRRELEKLAKDQEENKRQDEEQRTIETEKATNKADRAQAKVEIQKGKKYWNS